MAPPYVSNTIGCVERVERIAVYHSALMLDNARRGNKIETLNSTEAR